MWSDSLVTLALQNALLIIVMHYSRVSTAPSQSYSAATAVLLNELLKGTISFCIAFTNIESPPYPTSDPKSRFPSPQSTLSSKFRKISSEIFSPDCWKLSIPAILYVIQNNLQFVAASNLDVATFQVTYQMKILTTAAFSVLLLRRKLTSMKWIALLGLAVGVGVVQIQSGKSTSTASTESTVHANESLMSPLKGFLAVSFACVTSGLAGVYFEMVLKSSQADLWIRNVQLSLFSLIPAATAILLEFISSPSSSSFSSFENFTGWAWATVFIQVFGGLVTAVVIKYSDNIMKGFATSLSIIISFLASVALFDFRITPAFVIGASVVLSATWMYNQPAAKEKSHAAVAALKGVNGVGAVGEGDESLNSDAPILGQPPQRRSNSLTSLVSALGMSRNNSQSSILDSPKGFLNGYANGGPPSTPASPVFFTVPAANGGRQTGGEKSGAQY
jgi:UDP-sugar transporter A1/2/3